MKQEKFNVIIPIIKADLDRILLTLPYIMKNLPVKKIIVIANKDVKAVLPKSDLIDFVDEDALELGLTAINVRQLVKTVAEDEDIAGWYANKIFGWYFQQFLKMSYARVCMDEAYLVWDADTLPLTNLQMVNGKTDKYYFTMKTEYNEPYFKTMEKIFMPPLKKMVPESFIAEHMVFDCNIMNSLLDNINGNQELKGNSWFEKIMYAIGKDDIMNFSFSEFETYGNYCIKYFSDMYEMRTMCSLRNGRTYLGMHPSDRKLRWASKSFDVVSFERWDRRCLFSFIWLNPLGYLIFNPGKLERGLAPFILKCRKIWRKIKDIIKAILKIIFRLNYVKGIGLSTSNKKK